jgi:hypothetical protein
MSEPAMKNDCRPMHGTVDADLWDAKQHRARLAARVMNYDERGPRRTPMTKATAIFGMPSSAA